MKYINITSDLARRVLEVVDAGLSHGVGDPIPGKMCVEAAVCYALGQAHGDDPICVDQYVRTFKITVNDENWSSKKARAIGLRRIAIAQLGTAYDARRKTQFDSTLWRKQTASNTLAVLTPIAQALRSKEKHEVVSIYSYSPGQQLAKELIELATKLNAGETSAAMSAANKAWSEYANQAKSRNQRNARLTQWAQAGLDALITCKSRGSKFLYLADKADRKAKRAARKARR